jgi:hypothetical protein
MGTQLSLQARRMSLGLLVAQPNCTLDLRCVNYAYLLPHAPILPHLNLKLMSVPQRWADILISRLPEMAILIKLLSCLFTITLV